MIQRDISWIQQKQKQKLMEKGNWWIHKKETILHYILDNNYLN